MLFRAVEQPAGPLRVHKSHVRSIVLILSPTVRAGLLEIVGAAVGWAGVWDPEDMVLLQ